MAIYTRLLILVKYTSKAITIADEIRECLKTKLHKER